MSNNLVDIISDYEYVLGNFQGNVLNLQAQFQSSDWTKEELYIIAKELEQTGKLFAEQQGLGMSTPVESINGTKFSIINYHKTGQLVNSIHAVVEGNGKIHFFNNARNSRGQYYAGHIEYGFHDRGGGFVPARPFMRPALYAVSESSKGHLTGAMKHFLQQGLLNGIGYSSLSFGRAGLSGGGKRVFYQQSHMGRGAGKTGLYTSKGLLNPSRNASKHFTSFKGNSIRGALSTNRRTGTGHRNFIGRDSRSRDGTKQRAVSSTKRFGHYGKGTRKPGRPSEGKMSHLRRTGKGRGRPATGRKSRKTGNKRGRPPKQDKKTKSDNPYKHHLIKRDIKPSYNSQKSRITKEVKTESKPKKEKKFQSNKPPLFYNTGGSSINPYKR